MFANTLTLNFVGTDDLVLTKRREDNMSSEYFGTIGAKDFVLHIKHTIPRTRNGGETSHLIRIDVTEYNNDNEVILRYSTWRVFTTQLGRQPTSDLTYLMGTVDEVLASTGISQLLNGES